MKLKDVELIPGVVVDSDDPKKIGRVKATVPGVLDSTVMTIEGMPWIYPLTMAGYQQYSKLIPGSKIWVFKIENNMKELWYIPLFQLNSDLTERIKGEISDVIFHRTYGSNTATMYYTENNGINMEVGDSAHIHVKPDSTIDMFANNAKLKLDTKVKVGGDEASEQMVRGNKLQSLLRNLSNNIKDLASAASSDPTKTGHLVPSITNMSSQIDSVINDILSDDGVVT